MVHIPGLDNNDKSLSTDVVKHIAAAASEAAEEDSLPLGGKPAG
jgi:hypothetical protein